jgi:hypothetical protein
MNGNVRILPKLVWIVLVSRQLRPSPSFCRIAAKFGHWTSFLSPFPFWASTGDWLKRTGDRWVCPPTEFPWVVIVSTVSDFFLRSSRVKSFSLTIEPSRGPPPFVCTAGCSLRQGWWYVKFCLAVLPVQNSVFNFGSPSRDVTYQPADACSSLGVWTL